MPRANRYFLPNHVWHITHRCHQQRFLLKFAKDREAWLRWLFEAKRRFGLCVLDYIVTANHIHLLVQDQGRGEISRSMQLIAGRTAQAHNRRKDRKGAFWEDRYHATAVDTDMYLARCLVYIDLNMVRAGVAAHPSRWPHGGYHEIQNPPKRYAIIDWEALQRLLGMDSLEQLQTAHSQWVEAALSSRDGKNDDSWSESLAIGRRSFVETVKAQLGGKGRYRRISPTSHGHVLREPPVVYSAHFVS